MWPERIVWSSVTWQILVLKIKVCRWEAMCGIRGNERIQQELQELAPIRSAADRLVTQCCGVKARKKTLDVRHSCKLQISQQWWKVRKKRSVEKMRSTEESAGSVTSVFRSPWDSAGKKDMHLMSLQFHAQGKRGVFAEANGRDTWQQDERQDRIVNGTQDTRCEPPNYNFFLTLTKLPLLLRKEERFAFCLLDEFISAWLIHS